DFPEVSQRPATRSGVMPTGRSDRRTSISAPGSSTSRTHSSPRPSSTTSTLSRYGLHAVEPTKTAEGLTASPRAEAASPAEAKSRPAPALSPLLKDLVGRTEYLAEIRPKIEKCPKCGHDRFSSVGWCLSCGYSPKVQEPVDPKKQKPIS